MAAAVGSERYRCEAAKKYQCSFDACVVSTLNSSYLIVDLGTSKVSRCDAKGCDDYLASVSESGAFVTLSPKGASGTFVKLGSVPGDSSKTFSEVVSLGMDLVIYYGICTAQHIK